MKKGLLLALIMYTALLIYLFFTQDILSWLFSYIYLGLISILIVLIFLEVFNIKIINKFRKIIYFIVFMPIGLFPLLKCYFKIPYVFCNSCPNKCAWGYYRALTVPSFVLLNIDKRRWCFNHCPFGYLQDLQKSKTKIKLPKYLKYLRYIILVLVLFFWLLYDNYGYKSGYTITVAVLILAIVTFITSFFIHRFFCNYICPIGTVGDICIKCQKYSKKI